MIHEPMQATEEQSLRERVLAIAEHAHMFGTYTMVIPAACVNEAMGELIAEVQSLRAQLDQRFDALAEIKHLEAECERLRAMVPKWISVLDELPANDVVSVIYLEGSGKTGVCEMPMGWNGLASHTYITHWCALPSTPSKEQQ